MTKRREMCITFEYRPEPVANSDMHINFAEFTSKHKNANRTGRREQFHILKNENKKKTYRRKTIQGETEWETRAPLVWLSVTARTDFVNLIFPKWLQRNEKNKNNCA